MGRAGRTKWLDGLRGIAAAIVAFDHFFMSDIWHPFVSFWTEPPELNRHIVQLPPIRILFSAHGMVTVFMVISGYAISIGLLKDQTTPQFLNKVSSAIMRRAFRIYIPVLVIASLAQFFYFFDLFSWNFDDKFLERLPKPWSAPLAHVAYVLDFLAECINIVSFRYPGSLNGQLWTMPIEFRGSNIVYLLIIGLSAWRLRARLYILPVIAGFFLWYGNWDVFGFTWGLWLAERAAGISSASGENDNTEFEMADYEERPNSLITLPSSLSSCFGKHRYTFMGPKRSMALSTIATVVAFITGFYLLCLGNDGHLPPGYQFLAFLQPSRWSDWDICHMCWKSVGAVMLVYAIGEFPLLQRPLNSWLVQYLGEISFALYLLHEMVYQVLRNPLRNFIYFMLCGKAYLDSGDAFVAHPFSFHVAWWVTGILLGSLAICAAHFYTVYVDNKCVALVKRVDRWLSS